MRTVFITALAALTVVLLAPAAFAAGEPAAEPTPKPEAEPTPEPMKPPQVTEVIFGEADAVDGTRHDPGTDLEQMRAVRPWRSLVTVRADFVPALLESAETL